MEVLNVLVVDDEPGMRLGSARVLKRFSFSLPEHDDEISFEVDTAEDGAETLSQLQANKYDIVLLDYKLPDMTGLDILQWMREQELQCLTVMVTAYASLDVAVSTTKNGAFDFLAKPFTPDDLKTVVRKTAHQVFLARQARKLAEEKRRVRFQFISVLAHELKAPLAVLENYMNIMHAHTLGDELVKYDGFVDRCLTRIGGMRKMILDLLDLTRIESGQKVRELKQVDVIAHARNSVEAALAMAQENGISVELHAPESLNMVADGGELEIILNNMISNAVKYNRENGRVDVSLRREADVIGIEVKDTGIGMSKEDVARLFGEFVRIKNSKTAKVMGSGLGLSILRKLSSLYEGEVTVESEPDVGSTFTVTLRDQPLPEPEAPTAS